MHTHLLEIVSKLKGDILMILMQFDYLCRLWHQNI